VSHGTPSKRRNARRRLRLQNKHARKNVLGPAPAIETILEAVPANRSPFVLALADKTPSPLAQAIEESNKGI